MADQIYPTDEIKADIEHAANAIDVATTGDGLRHAQAIAQLAIAKTLVNIQHEIETGIITHPSLTP